MPALDESPIRSVMRPDAMGRSSTDPAGTRVRHVGHHGLVTLTLCACIAWGAWGSDLGGWSSNGFIVISLLFTIGAVITVLATAAERQLDRRSRRAWRWVAVSLAVNAIAGVLASVGSEPLTAIFGGSRIAAGLSAASPLILLLAFLQKPSVPVSPTERAILVLDGAIIAVGGTLAVWYELHTSSGASGPTWVFAASRATLIIDAVFLLLLFAMWQRTALVNTANTLVAVGLAICCLAMPHLADAIALGSLSGAAQELAMPRSWIEATHLAGMVLIAVAARIRRLSAQSPLVRSPAQLAQARSLGRLDLFVALTPGALLLCRVVYDAELAPFAGLVGGVAAMVIIALLRQHASAHETVRTGAVHTQEHTAMHFNALVQYSSDVTTILDEHGGIRYVSAAVANVLGLDPRRLVGRRLAGLIHPDDVEQASQFLANLRPQGDARLSGDNEPGSQSAEWRVMNAAGEWITVENVATNLLGDPVVRGIVLNTRDVTEQRLIKHEYLRRASHDQLTDLANRASFVVSVEQALLRRQRSLDTIAILLLDIDGFRVVNESMGHTAGDALLLEASRRLKASVRDGEVMARLNGDEFAILVEQQVSTEVVERIANRIAEAMSRPFHLHGGNAIVSTTIGIALSTPGEGAEDLMRNADVAVHVAKTRGQGHIVQYAPEMHRIASERLLLEADLREAIDGEEFLVEYQPIVVLETGQVIGAEALVRWSCSKRGIVSPGVFIPVAEETGLIVPIGRWVLQQACVTAREWEHSFGVPLRITVNLSARQLQDARIVEDVRDTLASSGLDASRLTLELTESTLMSDTALSLERLIALKALGVSLAIDDFGTGYSSLGYLQRYPIDVLKIDKSFVESLRTEDEGPVLAGVIVALGSTLHMHTVAEGIETELQRTRLQQLGCELGQGFMFSRPLPADAFATFVASHGTTHFPMGRARADFGAIAA